MRIDRPLPDCLTRHGITSAHDNLQEGQVIDGLTKEIVRLFGKDMLAVLSDLQHRKAKVSD